MLPTPTPQFGTLKLQSVNDLEYAAVDRPIDTFWRAIDKAVSCFDALEIVPASAQQAKYREAAADSFKAVLASVKRYGKNSLSGGAEVHLQNAIKALEEIKAHINEEAIIQSELEKLREIAEDYPQEVNTSKNVFENNAIAYGLITGDNGVVANYKDFKP